MENSRSEAPEQGKKDSQKRMLLSHRRTSHCDINVYKVLTIDAGFSTSFLSVKDIMMMPTSWGIAKLLGKFLVDSGYCYHYHKSPSLSLFRSPT